MGAAAIDRIVPGLFPTNPDRAALEFNLSTKEELEYDVSLLRYEKAQVQMES